MKYRALWIIVLVAITIPTALYAVGGMGAMGGMGSTGGMVDKVYLQTATVGQVEFSHRLHGTRCNECHPKLYEKKVSNRRVSMKAMERGQSCGACHNDKVAFTVAANCTTCHAGDILYKEEDAGDVVFSHAVHGDLFGCDSCHPDIYKAKRGANKASMEEMEAGKSCGACHDGSTAFGVADDCTACHKM